MSKVERKLDELEDKVSTKAPPEPDNNKGNMAEKLENDPELRQAFREFRKAKQRGYEPDQKYVEKIRKAQNEAKNEQ